MKETVWDFFGFRSLSSTAGSKPSRRSSLGTPCRPRVSRKILLQVPTYLLDFRLPPELAELPCPDRT